MRIPRPAIPLVAAGLVLGGCSTVSEGVGGIVPHAALQRTDSQRTDSQRGEELVPGETEPSAAAEAGAGTIEAPPQVPALSPMPPGTALDISGEEPTPGHYFDFQICTAAWSFSLDDGRTFAVTASHCGKQGDKVWAGSADGTFTYPADPIGEVVYSDLYSENTHGLDVAFIELYPNGAYYTGYSTPKWMHTSVAAAEGAAGAMALPEQVCKLGRITGDTCGRLTHAAESSTLNSNEQKLVTTAARAAVCGTKGDSGGPVYDSTVGTIVGVVSGTTASLPEGTACGQGFEMELSFTPAADIQALIPEVLGGQVMST